MEMETSPNRRVDLQHVKYRCLYLVVVIADLIQTIVTAIMILITFLAVEMFDDYIKQANFEPPIGPTPPPTTRTPPTRPSPPPPTTTFSPLDMRTTESTEQSELNLMVSIWTIRITMIIILILLIVVQYFGWKGYKKFHFVSTIIFAIVKSLGAVGALIVVCYAFTSMALIGFVASVVMSIIPILYAIEIKKQRDTIFINWTC